MTNALNFAQSAMFRLDVSHKPWRVEFSSNRFMALFFAAATFCLTGMGIAFWQEFGAWLGLLPILGAAITVPLCVADLRQKGMISFDAHWVTVAYSNPPRSHRADTFLEPLTAYRAVRYRELVSMVGPSGSGGGSTSRTHVIDLVHPDESKSVPLLRTGRDGNYRADLTAYAHAFDLPARELDGAEVVERAADDLDKTLAERSGARDFQAGDPPPGLHTIARAGAVEIVIDKGPIPVLLFILFFSISAALTVAGFFMARAGASEEADLLTAGWVFLAFGLGVGLLMSSIQIVGKTRKRAILLTRSHVELGAHLPVLGFRPRHGVAFSDIETVAVHQPRMAAGTKGYVYPALRIVGAGRSFDTGVGLSMAAIEWLRGRVSAAVMEADDTSG